MARTSAFALKGMKLDVREIGKMLDVQAVLEGSVRKAGTRLRVTAQLEDRKKVPVSATCLAFGFAALGDLDSAFEWLETAVRERDSMVVVVNVYGQSLARDPRFGAFLDRLGLPR
ncbi:MAG: hypothetical protein OEW05_11995 [Candidatus Aminicenantes bacterium]|nr:hypothetical protein [Candidatus Aminicenantes bacterium]